MINEGMRLAEAMQQAAHNGASLDYGEVVGRTADRMSVRVHGEVLDGLPFTSACNGVSVGDMVVVMTQGRLSIVAEAVSDGSNVFIGSSANNMVLTINGRQYGVNKVLATTASYMDTGHTITLSEAVSKQPHGIVLCWCWYISGEGAKDYDWVYTFVPKSHISNYGASYGVNCFGGSFAGLMAKYVYVKDTSINGYGDNVGTKTIGGATFNGSNWVLRYVIGV